MQTEPETRDRKRGENWSGETNRLTEGQGRWSLLLSRWIDGSTGNNTLDLDCLRSEGKKPTWHASTMQVPGSWVSTVAALIVTNLTPGAAGWTCSQGQGSRGAWLTGPWPPTESLSPSWPAKQADVRGASTHLLWLPSKQQFSHKLQN